MRRKNSTRNRSCRNAIIFGTVFNIAAFFILTFLATLILSLLKNPLKISGIASFCVLLFTGMLSGSFTAKYKGEYGIFSSFACTLIFAFALLGTGLILSGGKVSSITLVNLVSYVALAFIFAILTKKRKKHRRTK